MKNLTIQEVSERLRVGHNTLEKWRKNGEGPPFLKVGHWVRYPEESLNRWMLLRLESSEPGAVAGLVDV